MVLNLFSLSGLAVTLTSAILIAILLFSGKTRLHRVWTLFNCVLCVWGIGIFFVGKSSTISESLFSWRIAHAGGLLIAIVFYHVVCLFCGIQRKKTIILAYIYGAILELLNITGVLFSTTYFIEKFGLYYPKTEHIIYPLGFIPWLFLAVMGHLELLRYYRGVPGIKRHQTIYFFISSLIGFAGGTATLLPIFGLKPSFLPFGNFTIPIYCIATTYAIFRYRLMDIRIAVTRAGIFLVLYTLILGLPFYFGYRTKSWFISTSFAVVLASIGPIIYRYLQSKAEEVLLSEQRHYQKILVQAAGGMTREHNLDKLCKLIVYIVKRTVKNRFAAIVVNDRIQKTYTLRALRNSGKSIGEFNFTSHHPVINYLAKTKEPILYDELPPRIRKSFHARSRIDLIIPSYAEGKLLGFLLLGEKINRRPYTPDDINIFKILSHQTALAIENCVFFEEFKEAQERIFTAEKLASIGGMADGVAHQIKNRLNHFSVASGEMKLEIEDFIAKNPKLVEGCKDLQETFEYLKKITDSLVTNVKRTDGVVKGILNFARTEEKDKYFSSFPFNDLIEQALELLAIKHQVSPFPLDLDADPKATIYGVKSQLKEVIYNILDNDFEAIEEKRKYNLTDQERFEFKPSIKLKLSDMRNFQLIEITDNGVGIKKESHDKIFAPFFTTKSSYKSGSGIGMYVVRRIVEENHNGKIWFESTYMEGTKFFIRLPKKQ